MRQQTAELSHKRAKVLALLELGKLQRIIITILKGVAVSEDQH